MADAPHEIHLALAEFDRSKLPPEQQALEGEEFQLAVRDHLAAEFSGESGAAQVVVTEDRIVIRWEDSSEARSYTDRGIEALQQGDYERGGRLLQEALSRNPADPNALFNMGMLLSDQGRIPEALELLEKLLMLVPDHVRALIAIGVARSRQGDLPGAVSVLRRAVELDPADGYAQRTLGAALGQLGESPAEAKDHLLKASRLLPNDSQTWYNLGRVLQELGELEEADTAFLRVLELEPAGQIRALAEKGRGQIAEAGFREQGDLRPDALSYCLGALQRFERLPKSEIQKITYEIAMLGTRGLDVNDPAQKYSVNSIQGKFSGLHLLCIEYVGFQLLDPSVDLGFDLSAEYAEACRLHGRS